MRSPARAITAFRGFMLLAILLQAILVTNSCQLPWAEVNTISVHSGTLTLQWDPASPIPFSPSEYSSYRIYSRSPGSLGWSPALEVPVTSSPEAILYHEDFGDGIYEFAVTLVDSRGLESAFATSIETATMTAGGWRVVWIRSE